MDEKTFVKDLMADSSVIGYVHCSEEGDILMQDGNEVDVLANVLVYFQQVAALIGDSFGLEGFREAHIQGQTLIVINRPVADGAIGVILNNRAKINEVTKKLEAFL